MKVKDYQKLIGKTIFKKFELLWQYEINDVVQTGEIIKIYDNWGLMIKGNKKFVDKELSQFYEEDEVLF
jgi:hypothetical protein